MNIIKQGGPAKLEAERRKKDIKTFRCPLCGCEWEASFKNKEFRWIRCGYNDEEVVSDCPMEYCDGIGKEVTV